jgi:hypothetical protein
MSLTTDTVRVTRAEVNYGHKMEEVKGDRRKIYKEELCGFYCEKNVIVIIM